MEDDFSGSEASYLEDEDRVKKAAESPKQPQFNFVTELYEGFPMLVIPTKSDRYKVKMGLSKLKAVLDNLDYCKAWVEQQEKIKASAPKSYKRSFKPRTEDNGN